MRQCKTHIPKEIVFNPTGTDEKSSKHYFIQRLMCVLIMNSKSIKLVIIPYYRHEGYSSGSAKYTSRKSFILIQLVPKY